MSELLTSEDRFQVNDALSQLKVIAQVMGDEGQRFYAGELRAIRLQLQQALHLPQRRPS